MFYDKFIQLCNDRDERPTVVAVQIGLNKSSATAWKRGATPSDVTIARLAEHFGVPASYFKDDVSISNAEEKTDVDRELESLLRDLTDDDKRYVIAYAKGIIDHRK